MGCGLGFLGIYLGCLGANVFMADVPSVKDLAERNININKKLLKGKVEFITANWYKYRHQGKEIVVQESAKTYQLNPAHLHNNGKNVYCIYFLG